MWQKLATFKIWQIYIALILGDTMPLSLLINDKEVVVKEVVEEEDIRDTKVLGQSRQSRPLEANSGRTCRHHRHKPTQH